MASSPQTSGKAETRKIPRKRARLLYEHRISLYSLLVALPGIVVSGILIWRQPWSAESKLALSLVELFVWWLLALALHEQTVRPLQTLANVVAALREEDYSFRARGATAEDALGRTLAGSECAGRSARGSANPRDRGDCAAAASRGRNRCSVVRI